MFSEDKDILVKIGANYIGSGKCEFMLWASFLDEVVLKIVAPKQHTFKMQKDKGGYWRVLAEGIYPGTRYFYQLNNLKSFPDPASFYQPEGVHGASCVIDHSSFDWEGTSSYRGIALKDMIIYELHVGTFTDTGTFEAAIARIKELVGLGINAIEIMPVSQFPGQRNWGYDGVYPFAVQNSYGGPEAFKEFIKEAHRQNVAIILDVVYNHLGPEGNYFSQFGPYFTDKYHTPWGNAVNFDDEHNEGVRNFFLKNAIYWFEHFQIDALRLDAVHGIFDASKKHILQELAERTEEFSQQKQKKHFLIAESDLNDVRIIKPKAQAGYGINAQWCDDFHHSLHTLLTGEKNGYYIDFGKIEHMVKTQKEGFVYSGQYSNFRNKNYGASSQDIPAEKFVVFSQNHDQIGNRMQGERLSKLTSFEALKLAAASVILSVYIPLLFMGEEYAEEAPFLYFVSHSGNDLIKAVREGRKHEFASFKWQGTPTDPQDVKTFLDSKLNWDKRNQGNNKVMLRLYQKLIFLRKNTPALTHLDKSSMEISSRDEKRLIFTRRWYNKNEVFCIFNFNKKDVTFCVDLKPGRWKKVIDSADEQWLGCGSLLAKQTEHKQQLGMRAESFALYEKEN